MKYIINVLMLLFFLSFHAMEKKQNSYDPEKPFISQICDIYQLPELFSAYNNHQTRDSLYTLCKYLHNAQKNFNQCDTKNISGFSVKKCTKEKLVQFTYHHAHSTLPALGFTEENSAHYVRLIAAKEDWTPEKTERILQTYLTVIGSLIKKSQINNSSNLNTFQKK